MRQNAMASDAPEGIGAFLEKRKRVWRGKVVESGCLSQSRQ
ncbi:MAG: hypothetical protein WB498_09635 [Candidatus Binatus sp.]|jgi:hypothetical protein